MKLIVVHFIIIFALRIQGGHADEFAIERGKRRGLLERPALGQGRPDRDLDFEERTTRQENRIARGVGERRPAGWGGKLTSNSIVSHTICLAFLNIFALQFDSLLPTGFRLESSLRPINLHLKGAKCLFYLANRVWHYIRCRYKRVLLYFH